MRTRTCVYKEIRNDSFPESFAYVLNEWSLKHYYLSGKRKVAFQWNIFLLSVILWKLVKKISALFSEIQVLLIYFSSNKKLQIHTDHRSRIWPKISQTPCPLYLFITFREKRVPSFGFKSYSIFCIKFALWESLYDIAIIS